MLPGKRGAQGVGTQKHHVFLLDRMPTTDLPGNPRGPGWGGGAVERAARLSRSTPSSAAAKRVE
jgi:hypothetical protein